MKKLPTPASFCFFLALFPVSCAHFPSLSLSASPLSDSLLSRSPPSLFLLLISHRYKDEILFMGISSFEDYPLDAHNPFSSRTANDVNGVKNGYLNSPTRRIEGRRCGEGTAVCCSSVLLFYSSVLVFFGGPLPPPHLPQRSILARSLVRIPKGSF